MFFAKTSHFRGCIDMVETPELSDVNQHTENTPFTMVFLQPAYDWIAKPLFVFGQTFPNIVQENFGNLWQKRIWRTGMGNPLHRE